jgi:hypothetical protein
MCGTPFSPIVLTHRCVLDKVIVEDTVGIIPAPTPLGRHYPITHTFTLLARPLTFPNAL